MPFEGMDVDQARGLASRLDANARVLADIAGALTGVASGLTLAWCGPASAAFEQSWLMRDRPALLAAAQALADAHARLVANIEQQQGASAATGAGGGGGVWPVVERLWNDGGTVMTVVGLTGIPVSLLADGSRLDEVFTRVGYVGTAMGVVNVAIDANKAADDLDQDHYAAAFNEEFDGVTDGLKAYPNPIINFIGVDLTLLHDDINLDWKDTPSPLSWANLKNDYLPVGESMFTGGFWEQAGSVLWGAIN